MPSAEKEVLLKEFEDLLDNYSDFFILDNKGLSVADFSELRESLKEGDAICRVVKNRVFKIALKNKKIKDLDNFFVGFNGVVFSNESIKAAKTISSFVEKKNEKVSIKAGYSEKKIVNVEYIEELSRLLTKEELIAKLLWLLNYPVQSLAIVLDKIAKQKESK